MNATMKTFSRILLLLGLAGATPDLSAVTVATPPAGYQRLDAFGGRDNRLSVPLVRRTELLRRIAAVGPNSVTLAGPPIPANAYAPGATQAYYAHFVSGNLAGVVCKILANSDLELTLETLGDDLSAHALGTVVTGSAGDLIRIRPYWTIADVFGRDSGLLLSPVPSDPSSNYTQGDALLLPDKTIMGTEQSSALAHVYVAGQGWRKLGQPGVETGAELLPPAESFVVRRQNAARLSFFVLGYVMEDPLVVRLPGLTSGGEADVAISLPYPGSLEFANTGLDAVLETAAGPDTVTDFVLGYSSLRSGFSNPPDDRYCLIGLSGAGYPNTNWSLFPMAGGAQWYSLRAGAGYVLRIRGERPVRYWRVNPPPY